MKNHFKCIGIVGHPRHPTALTTHEMLWRWLCSKGYEVLVEQQIAHELQLSNVKTGTLAEIGQTGRPRGGGGRRRQYARRGADPGPLRH
ncbi:NAD kinase [Klebsiella pneumoniae]|nr:NAD kinase [Klebsiella pneumoniae]